MQRPLGRTRARTKANDASNVSATPASATVYLHARPPPSETPTRCPNSNTPGGGEFLDDDNHVMFVGQSPSILGASIPSAPDESSQTKRSLKERMPTVDAVMAEVRHSRHVQQLLSRSIYFKKEKDHNIMFRAPLWEEVILCTTDEEIEESVQ